MVSKRSRQIRSRSPVFKPWPVPNSFCSHHPLILRPLNYCLGFTRSMPICSRIHSTRRRTRSGTKASINVVRLSVRIANLGRRHPLDGVEPNHRIRWISDSFFGISVKLKIFKKLSSRRNQAEKKLHPSWSSGNSPSNLILRWLNGSLKTWVTLVTQNSEARRWAEFRNFYEN